MPHGMISQCVVIKNDGQDTLCEDIKPRSEEEITPDLIRQVLREKGIAGMGGATLPHGCKVCASQGRPLPHRHDPAERDRMRTLRHG